MVKVFEGFQALIAINQDVTPAGRLVSKGSAAALSAWSAPRPSADCAVTHQSSQAKCEEGKTFFCFPNHTMYITGGCRGVFECDGVAGVKCDVDGCDNKQCFCK